MKKGKSALSSSKGFTLIELLVVIAIIGILSGIVLTSLNSARTKAADTKIKSQLSSMRAQAELFYSNSYTYTGVCAASSTPNNGLKGLLDATTGSGCNDTGGAAWAAAAPVTGSTWCVDSTGYSGTTTPGNLVSGTLSVVKCR